MWVSVGGFSAADYAGICERLDDTDALGDPHLVFDCSKDGTLRRLVYVVLVDYQPQGRIVRDPYRGYCRPYVARFRHLY